MEIGPESNAKIQVGEGEPLTVTHAVIERDLLKSSLLDVIGADGAVIPLPVGARVTLFQGPAVVFVGRVAEDQSVIDLLSTEVDDGEDFVDI